jgi:nitronate monooxygenase
VVDVVAPIPVVAAGGIADGRGLAAALALGATGAVVGTPFLASREAAVHPDYQARVLAASEDDTVLTSLFDVGWPNAPHRILKNNAWTAWDAVGRPPNGHRPGEDDIVAVTAAGRKVRRYSDALPAHGTDGDVEAMAMYAGQGVGLVTNVHPAGTIVKRLVRQADTILKYVAQLTNQTSPKGCDDDTSLAAS